ncbi:MAG TPA: FAD-dependent oxidoreductase [Acidobacteriota bacterium]|nr:FAD-dependent oxidoreductase [Acidobacteriota bacterium]
MATRFPNLTSPLTIRDLTIKNRVVSTAHDSMLADGGLPSDKLVAYHEARASGGAGLIITEVAGVHESSRYTSHILMATTDDCIPGFRSIAEACHRHDCKVFGQLFHPGRELFPQTQDGTAMVAYSASDVPNERFHVTPRALPRNLIDEIVAGFAEGAGRLRSAGYDGIEIVASHGYLPSQFLNPRTNLRTDEYGGSTENRLRFVREVLRAVRERVDDMVIGLRICGNEQDPEGLVIDEVTDICAALDDDVDYFSVIAGSSATLSGSIHIVPPMEIEIGYVAPYAAVVRERVSKPVVVGGRIAHPADAERLLATDQADMCGMTRALISDPELVNKTTEGRVEDIRVCIACNQACIGHMHIGAPISCIQFPESGRELEYPRRQRTRHPRRVLVAGGGPAGLKAAAVAAERGHEVTLYERSGRLGGQVVLAELLPGRSEFGGLTTNLAREVELAGVEVVRNVEVTRSLVDSESPDAVIVATGARPRVPELPGAEEAHVVTAWQVLRDEVELGHSVVIADWRCDWVGLGIARRLAAQGHRVRLCVNGNFAGQTIQQYVRDQMLGNLYRAGVEIIPLARLYGVDSDTVYFQHTTSGEPLLCPDTDTLVLALGHVAATELERHLEDYSGRVIAIGDCLCPRTAEEAVFDGLKAGVAV